MSTYHTPVFSEEDRLLGEKHLYPLLKNAASIPVSYRINGKKYTAFPENSTYSEAEIKGYTELLWVGAQDGVSLLLEARSYTGFAAIEWKLTIKNNGTDAIRVSDLNAADLFLPGNDPRVLLCNGDPNTYEGYTTTEVALPPFMSVEQTPLDGHPCKGAFPYQRLLFGDSFGFHIAIGWPGQWKCRYTGTSERTGERGVRFSAGQQYLDVMLAPGESVRSPLMLIIAFDGALERGINVWRRFYHAHIMPDRGGRPIPTFLNSRDKKPGSREFEETTEEEQLRCIREQMTLGLPLNLWWIDAGWYDCSDGTWSSELGTWEADPVRFPRGLAPIGELCAENGMEFLLWFEPERMPVKTAERLGISHWVLRDIPESPVLRLHPEIEHPMAEDVRDNFSLLNLADDACVDYITKKIGDTIEKYHVTVYRQDFNGPPLCCWLSHDTPDRIGYTENKYIDGYLRFWDNLRRRFPDLVIDSCASGGRRNDLESMRRAVVFHQTDRAYGNTPVAMSYYYSMMTWIPYFRGFNANWESETGEYCSPNYYNALSVPIDNFQFYANFGPISSLNRSVREVLDHPEDMEKRALLMRAANDHYRIAPMMLHGDFYPLTPRHHDRFHWNINQFDLPEERRGCIQLVRQNAAPEDSKTVFPAVSVRGIYEFRNCDTGEEFSISSEELEQNGLTVAMKLRSAAFLEYRVIERKSEI